MFDKKKTNKDQPEYLQAVINQIETDQESAESIRTGDNNTTERWEDEYKMLTGDQWSTSFANRSRAVKKQRPNSVDNFIFPAIENIVASVTSNMPDVCIEGVGNDDQEIGKKLTNASRYNNQKNKFNEAWIDGVRQYIAYGPIICFVVWDNDWISGVGPDRQIGDVRLEFERKEDVYFDPAIINLRKDMQECGFIHKKIRKKLSYIKERFPKYGHMVDGDTNDDSMINEGDNPKMVWLIERRERGLPNKDLMTDEHREKLKAKADELRESEPFEAEKFDEMATGNYKGVHKSYIANGIFLEYVPYEFDDGLYPVAYTCLYDDEKQQIGYGEIKNVMIPQILHNKADEIQLEGMSREGLGGKYYKKGSITPRQLAAIKKYNGVGGAWCEVENPNGLSDREGAKVPQSVPQYKEHKQRMVETITQNTAIQQGMSPGNLPYRAIAELGARTDVRTAAKIKKLENFLKEVNRLRINRFRQFYTEDRYFRIRSDDGGILEGKLNAQELMIGSWERDHVENPETGELTPRIEKFMPEWDIRVKILDERPKDRAYNTSTAFELFGIHGLTMADLWYALEEGKLPARDTALANLEKQNLAFKIMTMLEKMQPEQQQIILDMLNQPAELEFLSKLPEDIQIMINNMPPMQMEQHVNQMMELEDDRPALEEHIRQMRLQTAPANSSVQLEQ
jgi:hypothetical protein